MTQIPLDPDGEPASTRPPAHESTPTSSPEGSAADGGQNDAPPAHGEGEQDSW